MQGKIAAISTLRSAYPAAWPSAQNMAAFLPLSWATRRTCSTASARTGSRVTAPGSAAPMASPRSSIAGKLKGRPKKEIFKERKNDELQEQNLNTVILINPKNEEALYLLTLLNIKKSDYEESDKLIKKFNKVCKKICEKKSELILKLKTLFHP